MDWILVSERLPENECKDKKVINVLVTTKAISNNSYNVRKTQRRYDRYSDDWHWSRYCENVIAWMPLPKPYKDQSNQ